MKDNCVLLVDDDQTRIKLAADLKALAYEVIETADGFAAIECLEARGNEIGYVLCSSNAPGISGKQLIRQLQTKGMADLVFIFLVENPDSNLVREIASTGADGILTKPYDPENIGLILQSAKKRQEDRRLASYIKNIS